MKQLKDYLHLYLGCEVQMKGATLEKVIIGPTFKRRVTISFLQEYNSDLYRMKLILRPLTDMTEEEKSLLKINVFQAISIDEPNENVMWTFEQTKWLLSKHFDLFGLIEAGLAIDKTTLK